MMSLASLERLDAPFPVGEVHKVFDDRLIEDMVENFPDESLFTLIPEPNEFNKLVIQDNFPVYQEVIKNNIWGDFNSYVNSVDFVESVRDALGRWNVKFDRHRCVWWEFSSLPGNGGFLEPHPDTPHKLVSLVLWMMKEWDSSIGGGFDIMKDRNTVLHTCGFQYNGAVMFVKTPVSWHGVRPLRGRAGQYRRTVTISILR